MEGWIKLERSIVDNPLYFSEPFTRSQAWLDLLIIANHKEGMFFKRGIAVTVNRGQVGYDLDTLSKRWKWSRGKSERFLKYLENASQIVRQKTNVTTLISIINYDIMQSGDNPNKKPNSKANGHQTDTNNNDKKENNVKEQFESFRKLYKGTKRGLDTEFLNFKSKHKDYKEVLPLLKESIESQISLRESKKQQGEFVPEWKNLQTWINQGKDKKAF